MVLTKRPAADESAPGQFHYSLFEDKRERHTPRERGSQSQQELAVHFTLTRLGYRMKAFILARKLLLATNTAIRPAHSCPSLRS